MQCGVMIIQSSNARNPIFTHLASCIVTSASTTSSIKQAYQVSVATASGCIDAVLTHAR